MHRLLPLLLLAACSIAPAAKAPPPEEETLSILVAAAADVRATLGARGVVLDTVALKTRYQAAVAAALGARLGHRAEVLNCVPPTCRLEGSAPVVWFAPPSRTSMSEARVMVQLWTEGSPRTGAATMGVTLLLVRSPAGEWSVTARHPGVVT